MQAECFLYMLKWVQKQTLRGTLNQHIQQPQIFQLFEIQTTSTMEKQDLVETKVVSSRNKPLMLLCAALLGLLIVTCSVFTVLYVRNVHDQHMEWVGFKGSYEGLPGSMNEESEVDAGRRLIVHVNAEGWKLGINNSISLHDYNNGLLATRLMESGKCMIINLIDTFEDAVLTLHRFNKTGVAVARPMRYFDSGVSIPQHELDAEIGTTLAGFCRGFPTIRLHEVPRGDVLTRKRRALLASEPVQEPFEAVCIRNRFCYINGIRVRCADDIWAVQDDTRVA